MLGHFLQAVNTWSIMNSLTSAADSGYLASGSTRIFLSAAASDGSSRWPSG